MQQTNLLNITQPSTWTSPLLSMSTSVTCASKFFPNGSKGIKMTRHHGKNSHGKQKWMSDRIASKVNTSSIGQPSSTSPSSVFPISTKIHVTCFGERVVGRLDKTLRLDINGKYLATPIRNKDIGRRIRHTPTHRLDGILLVRQITSRTPTSTFLSINTWLGSYQPWHIFTDDPPIR